MDHVNYSEIQKSGGRLYWKERNGGPLEIRNYAKAQQKDRFRFMLRVRDIFRCEQFLNGVSVYRCMTAMPSKEEREKIVEEYPFTQVSEHRWVIDKEKAYEKLAEKYPQVRKKYPNGIYQIIYTIMY